MLTGFIKNKFNTIICVVTFSISFITSYLYMFVIMPLNSDTTGAYTIGSSANLSYKWSIANGRWTKGILEVIIEKLGYYNIVPFFLFILLFIVCLFFIYNLNLIFEFKNVFLNCFISATFFITPAFLSLFMFVNDLYAHILAIFLGAIIIKKCFKDNKWQYYVPLLTLMIGIYQSYICLMCSIFVIYNIYLILNNKITDRDMNDQIKRIILFIILSVLSICIYFVIDKIILPVLSIDSVLGSRFGYAFSIKSIIHSFVKMYGVLAILPFKNYGGINTTLLIKIALLICYVIVFIALVWFIRNSDRLKSAILILLFVSLPIAMNLILLASNHIVIQMTFGLGLVYLLLAVCFDYFIENVKINYILKYKSIIIKCLLGIILLHMIYFANGYQYFSKITSDSTKAFVMQLVSRIKSAEGYDSNTRVYFAGNVTESNLQDYYSYFDNDVFPLAMPHNSLLFPWEYKEAFNRYGAFKYVEPTSDEVTYIKDTDVYRSMPYYPNDGSIKKINDVLVIKFFD